MAINLREQPGFRLINGSDIQTIIDTVNGILAGTQAGTYTGTFNGVVGGTTPAAGSFTTLSASSTGTLANVNMSDNLTFTSAAKGVIYKQGANGRVGTFQLNGTTPVSVSNTSVAITDAIVISLNTVGGTVGALPSIKTITASTGFTVSGTALDTGTYNYAIIKNAA